MEDVLERYAEAYDADKPLVCFDECSKELHQQVADPILVSPGTAAKEDYEYKRNGTANVFVIIEPLTGMRHITVTDQRTKLDFAEQMKYLCELYPKASKIRVVLDNLNTHKVGSLFERYAPDEAWRIANKLEFHFTPVHASWLNMAECELSVLAGRCLNRRIGSKEELEREVKAYVEARNAKQAKIVWTFRVADARKKLDFLYPKTPEVRH